MDLLHIGLGCVQLSLSCPFRLLHTFHFLRPARLRTPLLGYGAPHLSAKGTSTLLNNALLSAHFLLADYPTRTQSDDTRPAQVGSPRDPRARAMACCTFLRDAMSVSLTSPSRCRQASSSCLKRLRSGRRV